MPQTINNVREFVINALKQYHELHTSAENTAIGTMLANYATYAQANSYYVAQEAGKGLSTEDFTTAYMTKLDGIEAGAQVNVKANWNESNSTSDAYIQNKPDLTGFPTYAYWDSTNHNIVFQTASDGTVLNDMTINGTDFIIDGMINSVSIEDYTGGDITSYGASYLNIDFNADAEGTGHTDIKIPLQDIFAPNNYYTKTETVSNFTSYAYVETNYPTYAYLADNNYTKTQADGLFPTYAYLANTYTTFAYTQAAYAYVLSTIEYNEEVVAAALADIDDRLDNLHNVSIVGNAEPADGKAITSLTVDSNDVISYTLGTFVTAETQLSLANVSKPADANGYTYIISEISVSNHTITPSYVGVLNTHQDISGKEDTTNKKDDLTVAANISSTYYATTYSVSSYVGSLNELTPTELNNIFGITSGS